MFVNLMTTDEWCNRGDHGATSFEPTWIEVKQAIERLDGVSKTMVTLSSEEGGDRSLIIAGQWAGRFMVNATIDSYDFFSLIDPSVSEEGRIILFVGGQDGEYEERKLVFLEEVLAAARVFLETGEMERSLNWISDY